MKKITDDRTLLIILAAAFILRLAVFLLVNLNNPDFGDTVHYIQIAENLAAGKGFTVYKENLIDRDYEGEFSFVRELMTPEQLATLESHYYFIASYGKPIAFWDPLLPFSMVIFLFLGDGNLIFYKLFGCLIGTVNCWLVYKIGERLFGRTAGMIALSIAAVEANLIFYSSVPMSENLTVFFLLISFLMLYKCRHDTPLHYYFTLGIALSLLYLTRANLLLLFPIVVVSLLLRLSKKNKLKTVLVALGFLAAASPWWARNLIQVGDFGFLPTKGVFNLWKTTADGVQLAKEWEYDVREDPAGSLKKVEKRVQYAKALYFTCVEGNTEGERAASLREHTLKFIAANPGLTLKRYLNHLINFFNPIPQWGNPAIKTYLTVTYLFILITGIWGMILSGRAKLPVLPLIVYAVIFIILAGMFPLGYRFRVPVLPILILFTGYLLSLKIPFGRKAPNQFVE